ncbi:unnamed protein product [Penicillium salamii]|nr:unnamed protein product [Penicillium salamii]CAG8081485.1 unnamed protein product [Penicillium salamii]CAG8423764.1 unnamed protein product [Penicillium salamii]
MFVAWSVTVVRGSDPQHDHLSQPSRFTFPLFLIDLSPVCISSMDRLHRKQESSEDSPISLVPAGLLADINPTNQLSVLLDQQHNELVTRQLNISEDETPDNILSKVLTTNSFSTTASSFAITQQEQERTAVNYRTIGFGQCGVVFERPGRNYVIKVARPFYEDSLWADFTAHFQVRKAFQAQSTEPVCRVPKLFSYVTKENEQWWKDNLPFLSPTPHSLALPAMAIVTERILPLPKVARQALINAYCPATSRPAVSANHTNRDCLARVYLGRRRPTNLPPTPNFTLRNYNLCLDQMIDLGLPVQSFAAGIGEALAIVHWAAHVDAYDIEFVLGSEGDINYTREVSACLNLSGAEQLKMTPHTDVDSLMKVNFRHRNTRLFVLDFNLCGVWDEKCQLTSPDALISHLVTSFFENDPYYPLPLPESDTDKKLWDVFSMTYITKAEELLCASSQHSHLPRKFIQQCIEREKKSLACGLGRGHRDHKE